MYKDIRSYRNVNGNVKLLFNCSNGQRDPKTAVLIQSLQETV